MRWFIVLVALVGCSKKKEEPKPAPKTEVAPVEKKPVPTTPLPGLAADSGDATGKPMWQAAFRGLGIDSPRGVAVGPDGSVYVCGYFDGEIDFGGSVGKKPSAGAADAFLAKLSPDGKVVWAQTWGAKRDDAANAIAVRGDKIVVVGNFLDTIKLGEFTHTSTGSDDVFVAQFDKDGNAQWLWTLGGIDSDGANAVAATPDGGWMVGGSFSDAIDIGNAHVKSRGRNDAFLAKLAAGGDIQWLKSFGGRYDDTIMRLAVDANGNTYVQGVFKDVADFGGAQLTAAGGSDNDIVLAKYDTNGDHVWSQRFGNAFNDVAGGVAVDPSGHVTMVGSFDKSISFGDKDDHTSLGEADVFITRLTPDGKLEWARTYGAEREDIASGVATDAAGNTITTGWFQGTVDFGKGTVSSHTNNKDVFVVKLDAKGQTIWEQSFGDHDHDQGRAIALDDKGNPIVVGLFRFKLSLVEPPIESVRDENDPVLSKVPKPNVFVVKLQR